MKLYATSILLLFTLLVGTSFSIHLILAQKLFQEINPLNRRAAMMLFDHLRKIASFSHFNNMNSTNLGIVFGPNLIRKTQVDHNMGLDASSSMSPFSPKDNKEQTDYLKSVTSFMIDNFEEVKIPSKNFFQFFFIFRNAVTNDHSHWSN